MNLKQLKDDVLLVELKHRVSEERRLGVEVLKYLQEIEQRGLYLERGFSSLFTFCVEELKYSEASAYRRVLAMRALADAPEVEEKLRSGRLSVANLSQAESYFQTQLRKTGIASTPEEKREVFAAIEGRSKREAERILAAKLPDALPEALYEERERFLADGRVELRVVLSRELMEKLEKIRELDSHSLREGTWAELLERFANERLRRAERQKPVPAIPAQAPVVKKERTPFEADARKEDELLSPGKVPPPRSLVAADRRSTWNDARGQCEYRDAITGRRCSNRRFLQIDHRIPKAHGGTHARINLRLLCAAHNRHMARKMGLPARERIPRPIEPA